MVRIAGARLTDEAWLCGDEGEMRLAASADSPRRRCWQWRWLVIAALVLVIPGFAVWAQYGGAPPGVTYVPAHMENGQVVPGTFK